MKAILSAAAAIACGSATCYAQVWNPATGHFYQLSPEVLTFHEARAFASARGGYLVSIGALAEEEWVIRTFPGVRIWLGYTDELTEGEWKWESGEPTTFTNWAPGEPNDFPAGPLGEDYAVMRTDPGFSAWVDWASPLTEPDMVRWFGLVEIPCIAVQVTSPPAGRSEPCGSAVELRVEAVGSPIGYSWTRNGIALADGPGVSGASTSVLKLTSLRPGDAGSYRVRVMGNCQSVVSQPAIVSVECPADLNADGYVDDTDFVLFSQAYNAFESLGGDFNTDGFTDDADFVVFARAYADFTCE